MPTIAEPKARPNARAHKAEQTRRRILLAAERLFAESGIEAVSLREIANLANHGNNNAVQYHFGSKAELVAAIFEFRVSQMEVQRGRMLGEAEAAGRLSDGMTLMEILCLPHLSLADERGKHPYAGFMSQYLTRYRPLGLAHAGDLNLATTANLRRLLALLERRLEHVPSPIANSRIALCHLIFVNMLVRHDHAVPGRHETPAFDLLVRDTLEIATDALCAPYRHERLWPHELPRHLLLCGAAFVAGPTTTCCFNEQPGTRHGRHSARPSSRKSLRPQGALIVSKAGPHGQLSTPCYNTRRLRH